VCIACIGKGKGAIPQLRCRRGAHLPSLGLWVRRWINHLSPWRMASATPDLRLLSQPRGITALWPVPNYTAWWTEAHVCKQITQDRCLTVPRLGVDPGTFRSPVRFCHPQNTYCVLSRTLNLCLFTHPTEVVVFGWGWKFLPFFVWNLTVWVHFWHCFE